jgi:F-type H+-transporting ATPase subunit b
MQILPNPIIIALQIGPFLVALLGLYYLLFKPVLAHLAGREDAISGAHHRAKELHARLSAQTAELEARLVAARTQIGDMRAARRAQSQREAAAIIAAAKAQAEAHAQRELARVQAEAESARAGLRANTATLAEQVAGRVLGRSISIRSSAVV